MSVPLSAGCVLIVLVEPPRSYSNLSFNILFYVGWFTSVRWQIEQVLFRAVVTCLSTDSLLCGEYNTHNVDDNYMPGT